MITANPSGITFNESSILSGWRMRVRFEHVDNTAYRLKLVYIMQAKVVDFEILRAHAKKLPHLFSVRKFYTWTSAKEAKCQQVRDQIDILIKTHNIWES